MRVVVQLQQDVAQALQDTVPDAQLTHAVLGLGEDEAGFHIQRMHPGAGDPSLASFCLVEAADADEAGAVMTTLQRSELVEAAYLEPQADLP